MSSLLCDLFIREVKIDQASYASGAVFIGVAPASANSWSGAYGFLNYRATQAFGSETLYGSYYSSGDIIGVLLDMDRGTLSFIKEGEDFHVCKYITINMGVAYHNLRSRTKTIGDVMLYPCFGLKAKHDKISLRKSCWLSKGGLGIAESLKLRLNAMHVLRAFASSATESITLDEEALFASYQRMLSDCRHVTGSRPGIEVAIDTSNESIPQSFAYRGRAILIGDAFKSRQGICRIIGYTVDRLWYSVESGILGAWFWTCAEFQSQLNEGSLSFAEEDPSRSVIYFDLDASDEVIAPALSLASFRESYSKSWSTYDSETLVKLVNEMADKYNLNPLRIPLSRLLSLRRKNRVLVNYSDADIAVKYTVLTVLNRAALLAIPLIDFGRRGASLVSSEYEASLHAKHCPEQLGDRSLEAAGVYASIKALVFTRTKQAIWNSALRETTTHTAAPGDEFDRPDDIIEIAINRLEPKTLQRSSDNIPYAERLSKSVLGQMMSKTAQLDDRALRRAYEDTMDDGQSNIIHSTLQFNRSLARAFFVKLIGEGADDHGGPYRAIFQTAIGEEAERLLDLIVPCPNAQNEVGENRDKLVFNSSFSSDLSKQRVFEFLGKLTGLACRNSILIDINLSPLTWKPMTGEALSSSDFFAVDVHLGTSLQWIQSGDAEDELLVQMLSSFVDKAAASTLIGDLKFHNPGSAHHELAQIILHLNVALHRRILNWFHCGISAIVPCELFAIFSPQELEKTLCGEPEVNIDLLQEATVYDCVNPNET